MSLTTYRVSDNNLTPPRASNRGAKHKERTHYEQFMILFRSSKNLHGLSGFVKKSAWLSTVDTNGTTRRPSSTSSLL